MATTGKVSANTASAPDAKQRHGFCLTVLVVGGIAVTGYLATHSTAPPGPRVALQVDARTLYFGEVWVDNAFQWTIHVTNASNREIEVVGFELSCQCTEVEPAAFRILPGQAQNIAVTLDLMPPGRLSTDEWDRDFAVRITPVFRDEMNSRSWVLQGDVRDPFVVSSPAITFPRSVLWGTGAASEPLVIRAHPSVEAIAAVANADWCEARVHSTASDDEYTLRVNLKDTAPAGLLESSVSLHAKDDAGNTLTAVHIPLHARVIHDVQASPSEITFGSLKLGDEAEATIALYSAGGRKFQVTAIENEDTSISVTPAADSQSANAVFQVRQQATRQGFQQAQIVFIALHEGQSRLTRIPVKVAYYGKQPPQSTSER